MVSPLCLALSDVSLGTRARYILAADEDVKNPNKETNQGWGQGVDPMSICLSKRGFGGEGGGIITLTRPHLRVHTRLNDSEILKSFMSLKFLSEYYRASGEGPTTTSIH